MTEIEELEPMYSTGKVASMLDVSPYTVREWIRDGKLKAVKWGGQHWRVPKSSLLDFLNQRHGPQPDMKE